jgi:hypothetical protein
VLGALKEVSCVRTKQDRVQGQRSCRTKFASDNNPDIEIAIGNFKIVNKEAVDEVASGHSTVRLVMGLLMKEILVVSEGRPRIPYSMTDMSA